MTVTSYIITSPKYCQHPKGYHMLVMVGVIRKINKFFLWFSRNLCSTMRRQFLESTADWDSKAADLHWLFHPCLVQRLLKSRWQPTSPEEIERHDRKVAARRKALGLPASAVQPPSSPPTTPEEVSRSSGPMTALLHMFSPPPPVPAEAQGEKARPISAIYSRDEVLQFPVSDTRGGPDGEMRRLDVPVKVSRKHMTFDELKAKEKAMERKKKLKTNTRLPVR